MAPLMKNLVSTRFLIISILLVFNLVTTALAASSHTETYTVYVQRASSYCRYEPCGYVCYWYWWHWWWYWGYWWGNSCYYSSTCHRCDTTYSSVPETRTRCAATWTGPNCDIPICSPACTKDGEICEEGNPRHQCRCVTSQGRTCLSVACQNGKSCYPGTCEQEVCKCPPEFSGDNCEQFKQIPEVSECRAQLFSGSPETEVATANCAVEGAKPDVTWVRTNQFTRILSNWEASYTYRYRPVLPTATVHIQDAKFGVTYSRATATLNVSTTAEVEPNPPQVTCKEANDYKSPEEHLKCRSREIKWSEFGRRELPDNSTIRVAITAKLGGFKTLKSPNVDEQITGINETTRHILFKVDSTRPWHCRLTDCKDPAISLRSDAVKEPVVEGNFTNWHDWTSGIDRYCVDVYQLLKANDVLEPSQRRTDTFCRSGVNSFQYTIPSPGVFSLLLKVYDKANNTATARKIVLFHKQTDGTNEGVTKTGEPLRVGETAVDSGYGWMTSPTNSNNGKSKLTLNWKGRYMNRKHLNEGWLLRTSPIPDIIDDSLLDTEERRTIHAVKHTNGTVGYKLAFKVDQQGGRNSNTGDVKESNVSNSNEDLEPLKWGLFDHTAHTATLVMPTLTPSDTISIWIRAFDVVGYFYEDRIQMGIDNSPPTVGEAVLRENSVDPYTSSIDIKAEDLECGIKEVRYSISTKLATNITVGTVSATKLKSDGNRRKRALRVCLKTNPDCYCIRGGDCFSRTIVVEIDHCKIDQHYRTDQRMVMDYVIVNQADMSVRAKEPIHILFASGPPTCRPEKFCDNENDTKYSIHWNRTIAGTSSSGPCPRNQTGTCSRECLPNATWSQPNCNGCVDPEINELLVTVTNLDVTTLDNQNVTAKIASQLSTVTNKSEGLNPVNLNASIEIIRHLSEAIRRSDGNATINAMEIKSIVKAVSNVLRPNNSESWETLKKENQNIATSILLSLDNYGRSLAALNISENRKEEENLILEAWSFEKSNFREIEFPSRSFWDENRGDGISISVEALQSSMSSGQPTLKMWGSYYRTVNEYLPGHKDIDVVNSRVLSFSIDGRLKRPVLITLRHNQEKRTGFQRKCAFWSFDNGTWDFDGCSVTLTNRTHTICSCSHLTNFAVLMSLTPKEEDKLLSLISIIGCSISAAALILTILIYALTWKQSKSAQATVLLNLCVALASAYIIFLAGTDKFKDDKYKHGCAAVAVLLHYFFLAAFFIMLIEGVELVLYIIFVFHVRRTRETIMLIVSAWVLPLIVVGVSLGSTQSEGYGHENACWLSTTNGLIWAFIGPVLFIVTANFVILIVVLSWMSQKKALLAKNGKKRDEIRATIWNLSVTCPVLGLGWLFGVLNLIFDHVVFQYLFVIVNSLQGLLIFIFHALFHNKKMNEKISSFYSNYICRCRKSKLSVSTQMTSAQEQSTSSTAASKATIEMTSAQEQSTSSTAASKATIEMTSAREQSTSSILALTATTEISSAQEQSTSSTPALTTITEMTLAQDQATSSTSVSKVSTEMSSAQEQSTSSTRASASTAEMISSQEQSTSSTSTSKVTTEMSSAQEQSTSSTSASKVTTEMSSEQEQSTSSTSAKDSSAANKKPTDKAKVVPRAVKYYEDLIGRAGQFAQRCSAAYDQWRL